jgi:hypothetical protein
VSPRVFRVVALPAPTEREKSQMYIQRYLPHSPGAGEVVIFDRSWYNRAGVERVMGFCTPAVEEFLEQVPVSRRRWSTPGSCCSSTGSRSARTSRRDGWRAGSTTRARSGSCRTWTSSRTRTGTTTPAPATTCSGDRHRVAPWYVCHSDDKKRARLNLISHLLDNVPYKAPRRKKVVLPKRQPQGGYKDPDLTSQTIPTRF